MLIKAGANVDAVDNDGQTALFYAVLRGILKNNSLKTNFHFSKL